MQKGRHVIFLDLVPVVLLTYKFLMSKFTFEKVRKQVKKGYRFNAILYRKTHVFTILTTQVMNSANNYRLTLQKEW